MRVDKSQIGLTFPSKRLSRVAQEASLRGAGAQHILAVGTPGCKSWRTAVLQVRPGDTVRVEALVLAATERGDDDVPPSGQPAEVIMEVHQRGGHLIEVRTGRESRKALDRKAMIADAVKSLRQGGRKMPASGQPRGRKVRAWPSDEIKSEALRLWKSRYIATDIAAIRQAAETWPGIVTERMMRRLGASGRPWPTRRKGK